MKIAIASDRAGFELKRRENVLRAEQMTAMQHRCPTRSERQGLSVATKNLLLSDDQQQPTHYGDRETGEAPGRRIPRQFKLTPRRPKMGDILMLSVT